MKTIILIGLGIYLIHVLCVFASTRVKIRRARRDREMITRYIQDQEKRG